MGGGPGGTAADLTPRSMVVIPAPRPRRGRRCARRRSPAGRPARARRPVRRWGPPARRRPGCGTAGTATLHPGGAVDLVGHLQERFPVGQLRVRRALGGVLHPVGGHVDGLQLLLGVDLRRGRSSTRRPPRRVGADGRGAGRRRGRPVPAADEGGQCPPLLVGLARHGHPVPVVHGGSPPSADAAPAEVRWRRPRGERSGDRRCRAAPPRRPFTV